MNNIKNPTLNQFQVIFSEVVRTAVRLVAAAGFTG